MPPSICTIVSKNYLGFARALVQSYRQHHPQGRAWVLVVDNPDGCFDPRKEPFDVVLLSDLNLPSSSAWCFRYGPFELCNSLKPVLLRHLLSARGETSVLYLDSDIGVFGTLDELETATRRTGLLITPHCTQDFPNDGHWPNRDIVQTAGIFNAGVIGVADSPQSRRFLDWWAGVLEHDCIVDLPRGIYVDQRYLDLVPAWFPNVHICQHPGVNVGHFNLHERRLGRPEGRWTCNDAALLLFHFTQINWSGRDFWPPVSRPLTTTQPLLRELIGEYARRLDEAGLPLTRGWPSSYARFDDGTTISPATRAEFRRQTSHQPYAGDPFSETRWKQVERRLAGRERWRKLFALPARLGRAGRRALAGN